MMADRIRTRMDELKMTNQDLADKSHTPLPTINRIVSGQTEDPKLQTILAIAMALDVSVDVLAGRAIEADRPMQESPAVAACQNMLSSVQDVHANDLQRLEEQQGRELELMEQAHKRLMAELEARHERDLDRHERHHSERYAAQSVWMKRLSIERNILICIVVLLFVWVLWLDSQVSSNGLIQYASVIGNAIIEHLF